MNNLTQKKLLDRLARVEGQVRAVRKMIEEDRACPDVLNQMLAARSGLEQAGKIVLETYVDNCLAQRAEVPQDALDDIRETMRVWSRYSSAVD
jgi:CsoR family transcriptional regulator, copper-sensing transcriptional repressor